jgi:hypothetical protein
MGLIFFIVYAILVTHDFVEYINSPLKTADTIIYLILPVPVLGNICEILNQ